MTSTRLRALEAAVSLVGTEGVRALTHGRVDAAAGLPPGSTSNHYRTRAALLAGVIEWLTDQDRSDAGLPEIANGEQLRDALIRMIEVQSGPLAARTRARYALFLEADEDAALPLRAGREALATWLGGILHRIGGESAAAHTALLMATCDGLLLHRITVDPQAPVGDIVETAVAAALRAE
ncbi:MAG TPA: TetR family transcriptional regulator [Terrimesophilobacter sp.]|nr:TetR family transcriptional regulator [Terrimesophilobacter sp.]